MSALPVRPPGEPAALSTCIRPAAPPDAALLQRWRNEASVRRHQPLARTSVAQLRAELAKQDSEDLYRGRGDRFQWIILDGERAAGWITLVVTNWEHGLAETGYALSRPFQRRGLMPRALTLLLDELFDHTALERVEARCSVENRASQRVLERLGFEREGLLRDYFVLRGRRVDNYLYAILKTDWIRGRR